MSNLPVCHYIFTAPANGADNVCSEMTLQCHIEFYNKSNITGADKVNVKVEPYGNITIDDLTDPTKSKSIKLVYGKNWTYEGFTNYGNNLDLGYFFIQMVDDYHDGIDNRVIKYPTDGSNYQNYIKEYMYSGAFTPEHEYEITFPVKFDRETANGYGTIIKYRFKTAPSGSSTCSTGGSGQMSNLPVGFTDYTGGTGQKGTIGHPEGYGGFPAIYCIDGSGNFYSYAGTGGTGASADEIGYYIDNDKISYSNGKLNIDLSNLKLECDKEYTVDISKSGLFTPDGDQGKLSYNFTLKCEE